MKKKTKKIIALIFAILVVLLVQTIGITYAKYMLSDSTDVEAEIAKWSFDVTKNGQQIKNIKLMNTVNKATLIDGKIAPGTSGEFIIVLDGTGSEVDIDYSVKFINEQNKPKNLKFHYQNFILDSASEINDISGRFKHTGEQRKEIRIEWLWGYETGTDDEQKAANNILDTQDGQTLRKYTFDIEIIATQSK